MGIVEISDEDGLTGDTFTRYLNTDHIVSIEVYGDWEIPQVWVKTNDRRTLKFSPKNVDAFVRKIRL